MSRVPEADTLTDAVRSALTGDLPSIDNTIRVAALQRLDRSLAAPPRTHVVARYRRAREALRARGPRVRVVLLAGALAIVIGAGASVIVGGRTSSAPGPLAIEPAQAATILRRAADHLELGQPLTGSEARVIRQDWLQLGVAVGAHGTVVRYVLPRTIESGYDAVGGWYYEELPDGAPHFADAAARATYIRTFDPYQPIPPKPRIESHPGPDASNPDYLNLTAREVLALPTDPARLEARLLGQRPGLAAAREPGDIVFIASRLLTFGPTPPAVQAALARILAGVSGVRHLGSATIGGRRADILAFPPPRGSATAERLAFDRRTGQLLEEIDVQARPARYCSGLTTRAVFCTRLPAGTVMEAIAYSTIVAPTLDTPDHPPAVLPVDGPVP